MSKPLPLRTALGAASAVLALAFLLLDDPLPSLQATLREDGGESTPLLRRLSGTIAAAGAGNSRDDFRDDDDDDDNNAVASGQRPRSSGDVVHTFFEPIDRKTHGPLRDEEAASPTSNSTEARTLDVWRSSWESRGWSVRVLMLEDARRHPDFAAYDAALNSVPLGGNAYYNRLCYLRWLAMAAVGGGWLTDFDVMPIARPSPSSSAARADAGRFTSYGGSVPSLLHGSSEEWTRMARLLLDAAENGEPFRVGKHRLYSDMMGMQALAIPPGRNYDKRNEVLQSREDFRELVTGPMTEGREYSQEECVRLGKYRAAHFSHATALGVDPWTAGGKGASSPREKLKDRPFMMKEWMKMMAKCDEKREGLDAHGAIA